MKYRRFGRTELQMPVISCGGTRCNLLGQGHHWFPGENAAKAKQFDWRAPLAVSPFAGRIPEILCEAHELLAGEPQKRLSQRLKLDLR